MTDPSTVTTCPLPAELEFTIIDNLSADKPSLASCSLVCSRWLPTSRRHLFQDITIKPSIHLHPDPLADFLDVLERSGGNNIEWAISPCIMKMTFDGSDWDRCSVLTCPLDLLCALLSKLPQLASLSVKSLVILDEPTSTLPKERRQITGFKLDELVVDGCSTRAYDDPRHLLALLSRFSAIHSLTVDGWWVWKPDAVPTISVDDFSSPTVYSLTPKWIRPICARAIYALLAGPASATDEPLKRISFKGGSHQDFSALSDFASKLGPAIQELELRVLPDLPGPLDSK